MAKTIVGTFDSAEEAARMASALEAGGVDRREIQVIDSAAARDYEQRWSRQHTEGGGFWSWLFGGDDIESERGQGFTDDDTRYYTEGLGRGEAIVLVTTRDENADRIRQLMERRGAQVEAHPAGEARRGQAASPATAAGEAEQAVPVVEEQVRIGKRTVQRGGVRVYSHVSERPVEEHLRLREERITVNRRPVDRPLTGAPGRAFEEQTVELTESAEEPVVEKRARVVEEVVIGKDVREREETVRERVRRTDVEVERTGGGGARGGFAAMEPDFRQHCSRAFAKEGLTYEQCWPAYRYGYELAGDQRSGSDWAQVEGEARRQWEQRNPGTWQRFKDSIRFAWDRGRAETRAA
jgi:uncharacterized protein (TIGR02271 family)